MQKGSNEPHHSSLSKFVVRQERIRWSSTLIVFALLSGIVFSITSGCSAMRISRSSTLGRTVKTIDTPFVSFVEPNGIERLIPIPAEGLVLADLLNQHTSFATQRSVSIPRSNSLQGNSQEAPATTMTDLSATEALAKNLFTALEDSEFNLQDSLVQQKQKELLAKIEPLLTSNPDSSKTASDVLEAYVQRMQETNRFESFVTYFNSIQSKNSTRYPTDQSPRILTLGAGQGGSIVDQQIILTRRNGERLLLNANSLHSTPLGSILLANGDRVTLSYEADYTENFNPDASARTSNRVVITGLSQSAGQAIELEQQANALELYDRHASPYSNLLVLTRIDGLGRVEHHLLPTLDTIADTATAIDGTRFERLNRNKLRLLQLQDGDIVEFANLELHPIIVRSRIEHRQLQLEALTNTSTHRKHHNMTSNRLHPRSP